MPTLGHYDPASPAVLNLHNGTLSDLNIVDSNTPVPTGAYAQINVSGHSAFTGTIGSTALYEGLTVSIAAKGVPTNYGSITTAGPEFGGKVDFTGKGSLVNNGSIDPTHGQAARVGVDVSGNGSWQIATGGVGPMYQRGSSLEFGGSVGSHQSVWFSRTATPVTAETLQIDKPAQFHADIDGWGSNDTIALGAMVNAGSLFHRSWGDELKLFDGKHEVADLKFSQDAHYAPSEFVFTHAGGSMLINFDPTMSSHQLGPVGAPPHHF
jgi:hypothetical protein